MPRKLCDPAVGQAEYEECLERRRRARQRADEVTRAWKAAAEADDREEDADEDD